VNFKWTTQKMIRFKVYDKVQDCLANSSYPQSATEVEKVVIRKRMKKFQLLSAMSSTTSRV